MQDTGYMIPEGVMSRRAFLVGKYKSFRGGVNIREFVLFYQNCNNVTVFMTPTNLNFGTRTSLAPFPFATESLPFGSPDPPGKKAGGRFALGTVLICARRIRRMGEKKRIH